MIDLSKFCNANDIRVHLRIPLSDSEHTYATNGHVVIRVTRVPEIAEAPFAEQCAKLFKQHAFDTTRQWFQIPELPDAIMEPCDWCECDDALTPCSECNGSGKVEQPKSVDVGDSFMARKYLALIKELPNCTICPDGFNAAWFKFDGGDGLLMPMRERR